MKTGKKNIASRTTQTWVFGGATVTAQDLTRGFTSLAIGEFRHNGTGILLSRRASHRSGWGGASKWSWRATTPDGLVAWTAGSRFGAMFGLLQHLAALAAHAKASREMSDEEAALWRAEMRAAEEKL